MKRTIPLFAVLLALAFQAGGCASAPFVRGVRQYAPGVAKEFRTYVKADAGIDTDTKAQRLAAADALDAAAIENPMQFEHVYAAWTGPQAVRDPYANYVDADSDLEPQEKSIRAENISRMDRLLTTEGGRFIYGGQ